MKIRFVFVILLISVVMMTACAKENGILDSSGESRVGDLEDSVSDTTNKEPTQSSFTGKIIQGTDSSILLAGDESEAEGLAFIGLSNSGISLEDGSEGSTEQLIPGMVAEVFFSGGIAESYPVQITADSIKILETGDDFVGLYFEVLKELYETDEGLNSNITTIAFDLSNVDNLSDSEKEALMYQVGAEYEYETMQGTLEELM